MSKTLHTTQYFMIVPSRQINALCNALHLLAILACFLNGLQMAHQLSMVVVVMVLWRFGVWRRKISPVYLSYSLTKGWEVSWDGCNYTGAMILDTTVIANNAIFLHFKTDQQSSSALLIAKDSMSVNDYRRLVVKLKLSGYRLSR